MCKLISYQKQTKKNKTVKEIANNTKYRIYQTVNEKLLLTYFKLALYSLTTQLSVFDLLHAVLFHYIDEPHQQCAMLANTNYSNEQFSNLPMIITNTDTLMNGHLPGKPLPT